VSEKQAEYLISTKLKTVKTEGRVTVIGLTIPEIACGYCGVHRSQRVYDVLLRGSSAVLAARCDKCGGRTNHIMEYAGADLIDNM